MRRVPSFFMAFFACTSLALAQTNAPAKTAATPEDAKKFVKKLDDDLRRLFVKASKAEWIKSNFITDDTEQNAASVNDELMAYTTAAIKESVKFDGLKLDAETARFIKLLRVSNSSAAPDDAKKREELTTLAAKMEGMYGKGKACKTDGKTGKEVCRDLGQLSDVLTKSKKYDEQLDAWKSWHDTAKDMRPLYSRYVELANEGAREIGFSDMGSMWRSGYDMTPEAFEKETDRLWNQVKPLYDQLHCYVRSQLVKKYGADKVPEKGPIPAHLLGNMWAQDWAAVYDLVEPYKGQPSLDVTKSIVKKKLTPIQMAKTAESFFVSLGLNPLPQTFWERSLFTKPKDREVVCHASAWDVSYNNDLRIKMCIQPNEEDLVTLHHELGHDYYFNAYYTKPVLFQQGANDGFHEAIGDTIALSMTPAYYKQIGLLDKISENEKALINEQMKRALEKIAFLPFGKMIDQWRWDVFAGKTKPESYTSAWWKLREKYQGVAPSIARTEENFDAAAKYHVAANVPYTRYFLAHILQFQFHRSLCQAAGNKGPLYACSIFNSKEAGTKLNEMLKMGSSQPWPDALEKATGQREMDATAILDYFAPLQKWLTEQNKGQSCGW